MKGRLGVLCLALAAAGCVVPVGRGEPPSARTAAGADVSLQTRAGVLAGELLETRDTALLVLSPERRVLLVPFSAVQRGAAAGSGVFARGGQAPGPRRLARIRMLSRYPQGVPEPLLRRLLALHGQQAPDAVQP